MHANKVLSTLKQAFNYAVSRGELKLNSAANIRARDIGGADGLKQLSDRALPKAVKRMQESVGHKMPKIMATYNKNEMLPQRKIALEQWSDMEHIGSTAVPELSSKPIIDIFIVVPSINIKRPRAKFEVTHVGMKYYLQ